MINTHYLRHNHVNHNVARTKRTHLRTLHIAQCTMHTHTHFRYLQHTRVFHFIDTILCTIPSLRSFISFIIFDYIYVCVIQKMWPRVCMRISGILLWMTHCNLICEIDFIAFAFASTYHHWFAVVANQLNNSNNSKRDMHSNCSVWFCFVLFWINSNQTWAYISIVNW